MGGYGEREMQNLIQKDPTLFRTANIEDCAQVDQTLGFRINEIEQNLLEAAFKRDPEGDVSSWGKMVHDAQSWIGLHPQTLLTPYHELQRMCELIDRPDTAHFVDLGAGYGRMGLVLSQLYPEATFTGVEVVQERVEEGNRVFDYYGCKNSRLIHQNLFDDNFQLPIGDCYLIYDYGTLDHIRWTMGQLQNLADIHRFQVIARGKGIQSLIIAAHPWLFAKEGMPQEENFTVYKTYLLDS